MHEVIPQAAVIHVHSVDGIAWAVRADDSVTARLGEYSILAAITGHSA